MTSGNHPSPVKLGLGIGWRPEIALFVDRIPDLGFVEIVAESIDPAEPPEALLKLRERGVQVVPHGISLSLGGADRPDAGRLDRLARLAERFASPVVTEHVAFVRAEGVEAGHLLPVPRTRGMVDILAENVAIAQGHLPVPLGLENIAALVEWPGAELSESEFLAEVLGRTGALLLLDAANVHAARRNFGLEPRAAPRATRLRARRRRGGARRRLSRHARARGAPRGVRAGGGDRGDGGRPRLHDRA